MAFNPEFPFNNIMILSDESVDFGFIEKGDVVKSMGIPIELIRKDLLAG